MIKKLMAVILSLIVMVSGISYAEIYTDAGVEPRSTFTGDDLNFTVNGNKYQAHTGVRKYNDGLYGYSTVMCKDGAVPAGYLGAHSNLYNNKTGRIEKAGDWKYTTTKVASVTSKTSKTTNEGSYFTKGTVKVYNTSTKEFVGKTLSYSPVITYSEMGLELSEEELEERENLYETKGMIAATGEDGKDGYIKESDLYDEANQPKTIEDIPAYEAKYEGMTTRSIPLYDNDGETIIGEFLVDRQ